MSTPFAILINVNSELSLSTAETLLIQIAAELTPFPGKFPCTFFFYNTRILYFVPVVQRIERRFPKTKRMFYHTPSAVVLITQISFLNHVGPPRSRLNILTFHFSKFISFAAYFLSLERENGGQILLLTLFDENKV
jgi:hypothetical protein